MGYEVSLVNFFLESTDRTGFVVFFFIFIYCFYFIYSFLPNMPPLKRKKPEPPSSPSQFSSDEGLSASSLSPEPEPRPEPRPEPLPGKSALRLPDAPNLSLMDYFMNDVKRRSTLERSICLCFGTDGLRKINAALDNPKYRRVLYEQPLDHDDCWDVFDPLISSHYGLYGREDPGIDWTDGRNYVKAFHTIGLTPVNHSHAVALHLRSTRGGRRRYYEVRRLTVAERKWKRYCCYTHPDLKRTPLTPRNLRITDEEFFTPDERRALVLEEGPSGKRMYLVDKNFAHAFIAHGILPETELAKLYLRAHDLLKRMNSSFPPAMNVPIPKPHRNKRSEEDDDE